MVFRPILDLFRGRSAHAGLSAAPREPDEERFVTDAPEDALYGIEPLRILISPLAGDMQGLAARHIHDRLSGRTGVRLIMADRPLTSSGADYNQPLFVSMAVDLGRRWLKRENADLLVWGESISSPRGASWRLRFLGRATPLHPHSASFSALERLEVPALFDDATGDLAFGAALAAVNVESADGIRIRAALCRRRHPRHGGGMRHRAKRLCQPSAARRCPHRRRPLDPQTLAVDIVDELECPGMVGRKVGTITNAEYGRILELVIEQRHDLVLAVLVEGGGGFVEEDPEWFVQDEARKGQPLLLAE